MFLTQLRRSVHFSRSVVSDSLRPHESQHVRPPCPSPTPGVHPNPYSLSRWCHPTISSSVVPYSSCPQSFPASGSFPMSQFFASGGQRIGALASASVLLMNTQDWSPWEDKVVQFGDLNVGDVTLKWKHITSSVTTAAGTLAGQRCHRVTLEALSGIYRVCTYSCKIQSDRKMCFHKGHRRLQKVSSIFCCIHLPLWNPSLHLYGDVYVFLNVILNG